MRRTVFPRLITQTKTHVLKVPVIAAGVAAVLGLFSLVGNGEAVSSFLDGLTNPDRLVRWSTAISQDNSASIPVTFVDVDGASMQRFGAPAITPRDMLAAVTTSAREARAAGIFLDFDFALGRDQDRGHQALIEMIDSHPVDAAPLFLVRANAADTAGGTTASAGAEQYAAVAAAVERRIAAGAPIRFVAARARLDDDLVVRRWVLWETDCASGRTDAAPQLYAAAITAFGASEGLGRVDRLAQAETDAVCRKATRPTSPWPRNPELEARIPFRLLAADRSFGRDVITRNGETVPLMRRVIAHTLVRAGADASAPMRPRTVAPELFAGRFVIVGATEQAGDRYVTPLGVLPGAVIVANNVIGAPSILDARPIGGFEIAVLALLLFLPAFGALKWLRSIPAVFAIGMIALAAIVVFGRIYSPAVAFEVISYALAMLGIAGTTEALAEFVMAIRAHGWRAVLKATPAAAEPVAVPEPEAPKP
ncbi:MAG: CHASE2 domain-containing protein [Hyphomicrobiaceae bacterium]|nr:CHASE2 domain-containing protein [Hyphomicrobiaceae bacterium]